MSWISHDDNWFNLRHFFHIWIEKSDLGWFLMGEMLNGEEVSLSPIFDSLEEARNWARIRLCA